MKLRLFSGTDQITHLYQGDLERVDEKASATSKNELKDAKQGKINRIKHKFIPKVKRRMEMTRLKSESSSIPQEKMESELSSEEKSLGSSTKAATFASFSYEDYGKSSTNNSIQNPTFGSVISDRPSIASDQLSTVSDKPSISSTKLTTHSLHSNKSISFSMTNETTKVSSKQNTPDVATSNFTKTRSINRKRSKTLDAADLIANKNGSVATVPSRFRHYSRPPPVTGKTRSKFKSRRHSSSSSDNITKIVSNNSENIPITETSTTTTTTTKKKTSIISRIKSRSRSNSANSSFINSYSNSNLSLYSNSKDSHNSDLSLNKKDSPLGNPQRPPPPRHSNSSNTLSPQQQQQQQQTVTTSSSTYSLSRRSSSIVNALSSFVNLRSSSASSNKLPPLSPSNTGQPTITLDDLPTPPEPDNDDEPFDKYLKRISHYGKFVANILTVKENDYKLHCLNYYLTNFFDFTDDPLDIALRKLLVFLKLPKESQQIDRLLTEFGKVYFKQQKEKFSDKCIWSSEDQVYFILFSLLMLHTDYFNDNNKVKMTKEDFIDLVHNDTYSDGNKLPIDILIYYYDNVISKESPKFEIPTADYGVITFDDSEELDIYSPKDIIKNKDLTYDKNLETICTSLTTSLVLSPDTNTAITSNTNSSTSNISNITSLTAPNNNANFFQKRSATSSISSYFTHNNSVNMSSLVYQDDINIYSHILQDNVKNNSLNAEIDTMLNKNGAINIDDDFFYFADEEDDEEAEETEYLGDVASGDTLFRTNGGLLRKYNKFKLVLTELKGGYIMLLTALLYKLKPSFKWEIINENKETPYSYLKIIQISEIDEIENPDTQESSSNNTIVTNTTINNNAKLKGKIVILTTFGILIYEKRKSTMDMIKDPKIIIDESTGESNYIIKFKAGCEIISYHNLWAESMNRHHSSSSSLTNSIEIDTNGNITKEPTNLNNDYIVNLWGPKFKLIWRCCNKIELKNLINGINFMSSLEHCFHTNFKCLNNTVVTMRCYDYKSKYAMIQEDKLNDIKKYKQELMKLELYRQCVPISYRCRMEMLNKIKILINEIHFLQYEIRKDVTYLNILRCVLQNGDSKEDKINTSDKDSADSQFDTAKEYIKFIRFE